MKKKNVLSLLLCLALLIGILSPGSFVLEAKADDSFDDSDATAEGIEVNKTAVLDKDGNFTITLEAYASGSKVISTINKDKPTDIVLVLDQSGSMANCIVCGNEIDGYNDYHTTYKYTEANTISTNNTYYIKNGTTYTQVRYCNGSHGYFDIPCEGGAGWYISSKRTEHTPDKKITPKTASDPDGEQFYTRGQGTQEACTSRLSALKSAVKTFVNAVSEKAKGADGSYGTNDDIKHRIAIVGFGSDERDSDNKYQNTELFIGSSQINYNSSSISKQYGNALQLMNEQAGRDNIAASIEKLAASGGTAVDLGTKMANNILEAYKNDTDRAKVVIVFTDGVPGIWTTDDDSTRTAYANRAIANTYASQNTYNATVYTVGVFGGADASKPGSLTTSTDWDNDAVANKFMHLMSSNYLNSTSMTNTGSLNPNLDGDSYYLSAGDSSALNSIFKQISEQIESGGSSTTLGSETVVRDVVAPAFTMPSNASDIKVYTADSNGSTSSWKDRVAFGGTVEIDTEKNSISVSGFSFKDYWCGTETTNGAETFHDGKKLIIEFTVAPKDGFLGGNDVYTNAGAGVYENANATKPVVNFNQPQVNVPIKDITITKADKNVYLLEDLTAAQIRSGVSVKVGNVDLSLDPTVANYGLEDWQKEYVTISTSILDENNQTVSDLNALTSDKTYSISVSVTPITSTPVSNQGEVAVEQTGSASFKINVFKPVLTFKDGTVDYGSAINTTNYFSDKTQKSYESDNYVSTKLKWMHESTDSVDVTMLGTVPVLTKSYQYDTTPSKVDAAGKVISKNFVGVDVTVKIGSTDVTQYVTFAHDACASSDCTWDNDKGNFEFLLHVINKCADLTIQKQGIDQIDNDGTKEAQSVIFHIKGKTNGIELDVVIHGNGQKVIKDLPIDTYTVTEKTDWSWRYTPDAVSKDITLDAGAANSLTFTNTRTNPYWLNGGNYAHNVFGN